MIDSALFDVPCPHCGAEILELCTTGGRYMEATVHGPRRIRADVPLEEEPEPPKRKGGRPKGAINRPDPTKCASGKHDWNDENVFTAVDGGKRCRPCRNEGRRRRHRPEAVHHYGTDHCKHGHEYTAENTYRAPGNGPRRCITCKKNQRTNDYAKKKETA